MTWEFRLLRSQLDGDGMCIEYSLIHLPKYKQRVWGKRTKVEEKNLSQMKAKYGMI